VLASLEQALHRPEGFASYGALRQWLRRTHGVEVQDKTLYTLVRVRFKAKRKVARPRHTKKSCRDPGLPDHRPGTIPAGDSFRQYPTRPGV
jgi:hypothetical protein